MSKGNGKDGEDGQQEVTQESVDGTHSSWLYHSQH